MTTTHIGGNMYGDGEYVLEFSNVDSVMAPLKATVIGGKLTDPQSYAEIQYGLGAKPSVKVADAAIQMVRATVES